MKILWISNVVIPMVCQELNIPATVLGGWMDSVARRMAKEHEMVFVFPNRSGNIESHKENFGFYGFSKCNENYFESMIKSENPELIHIWGTEMKHSMCMIRACRKCGFLDRTVVSIQGLIHYIADYHYYAGLPYKAIKAKTFHDLVFRNSVYDQCKKYKVRGRYEIEVLKNARYVIGRTEWDYESVKLVNRNIEYFKCNESLRDVFYEQSWDIEKCDPLQIFMSQGHYPLKGLHVVADALQYVHEQYPGIKLVVISKDVYKQPVYKITAYQAYIKKLIEKYNLRGNVVFAPQMDAAKMADTICKSRIFINASSIENSSNSLGEAMLIGCPCIASNVGGTSTFITDGVDGLLYPFNEPYTLAVKILKLLSDKSLSKKLSDNARDRASEIFDRDKNFHAMLDVYKKMLGG